MHSSICDSDVRTIANIMWFVWKQYSPWNGDIKVTNSLPTGVRLRIISKADGNWIMLLKIALLIPFQMMIQHLWSHRLVGYLVFMVECLQVVFKYSILFAPNTLPFVRSCGCRCLILDWMEPGWVGWLGGEPPHSWQPVSTFVLNFCSLNLFSTFFDLDLPYGIKLQL